MSKPSVTDSHPAFGVAILTRVNSDGTTLFQSDVRHQRYMSLSIHHAMRKRSLGHEYTFPLDEIVTIDMSLAQWGELVSSVGMGSGVPVTIESINKTRVEEIPYDSRLAKANKEVQESVENLLSDIKEAFEELDNLENSKAGIIIRREARSKLASAIANAGSNAQFAINTMSEVVEEIVSKAKADIEAAVLKTQSYEIKSYINSSDQIQD